MRVPGIPLDLLVSRIGIGSQGTRDGDTEGLLGTRVSRNSRRLSTLLDLNPGGTEALKEFG